MTIVVCIKCVDGIAIASDSMLTIGEAQQSGQKIHVIEQQQLFAFAGDLSLAERFRVFATTHYPLLAEAGHKFDYATAIAASLANNLRLTGIEPQTANLMTVLIHEFKGDVEACLFTAGVNPRYLDSDHFSCAMGSGASAALPFLNFLLETFTSNRQPELIDGKLFATWAVKYAIDRLAGGVGGDIDLAIAERNETGQWIFRELPMAEVHESIGAIDSAADALRDWKHSFSDSSNTEPVPKPPRQ